jgi:L-ascorbate metabolism protein UlaG (beta-lactamase superfamily)
MPLPSGVELTWYGHATFLLQTPGGKRVLLDPWLENPSAPDGADPGDVDIVLLSHAHSDHVGSLDRIARDKRPAAIVCILELADILEADGMENVMGGNKGGTMDVGGLKVTLTHAFHSSSLPRADGPAVYAGEPCGLVIGLENGSTIYFAGDTDVFGDMALIRELYEPDVAILPIGDFFTMGPRTAAKAIELLGVKTVVPMHYGTFPLLTGTPAALREAAAGIAGLDILETEPGGTLR